MNKHTELPWSFDKSEFRKFKIDGATHSGIATVHNGWQDTEEMSKGLSGNEIRSNAEFIVKACNNHYQLLDALKKIRDVDGNIPTEHAAALFASLNRTAREAIKAAEKE